MSEAYEIQDSYLVEIEQQESRLTLKIDASKQVWPEGFGVGTGTGWMQPIELVIEGAEIESGFKTFPVELVDGEFRVETAMALVDDVVQGLIPASLSGSGAVELFLEGYEEDSDELKTATLRGRSAKIVWRGEPEFLGNLGEEE